MLSVVPLTLAAALAIFAAGQPAAPPSAPVELSTTYADGRVSRHVVTTRSSSAWTPYFPRASEWRSADGLPVTAINYRFQLDGEAVRVNVSVFLGQPHQKEIEVANVLVGQAEALTIEELSRYGVKPVVLAAGAYVPTAQYQPQIDNRTTALQIERVDVVTDGAPGYRVSVRNLSSKPVLSFYVQTHSSGKRDLQTRRGERDGTPIVGPGSVHTFVIPSSRSMEVLGITGLMFEDGGVEGDASAVATTRLVYLGRWAQLGKVLALLNAAAAETASSRNTIAALRASVEALPVVAGAELREKGRTLLPHGVSLNAEEITGSISAAMADTRRGVASDLQSAPTDPQSFTPWLQELSRKYAGWHARFAQLISF